MKLICLIMMGVAICLQCFAQVPKEFSFQGVARNVSGKPVANQAVSIRFTIHQGGETGPSVYQEINSRQTTGTGIFDALIGKGTAVSGSFLDINWSRGPYFLQVELDVAGGSNYVLVSTTQLLSVPYALVANNLSGVYNPQSGDILEFKDGTWTKKRKAKRYRVTGTGNNVSSYNFLHTSLPITIEEDDPIITLSISKIMGSTVSSGGEATTLALGYRKVGNPMGEYTPFEANDELNALRIPQRTRIPFQLSGTYQSNFKAGEVYEIGLMGRAANGGTWNDNGRAVGFVEVSY